MSLAGMLADLTYCIEAVKRFKAEFFALLTQCSWTLHRPKHCSSFANASAGHLRWGALAAGRATSFPFQQCEAPASLKCTRLANWFSNFTW